MELPDILKPRPAAAPEPTGSSFLRKAWDDTKYAAIAGAIAGGLTLSFRNVVAFGLVGGALGLGISAYRRIFKPGTPAP